MSSKQQILSMAVWRKTLNGVLRTLYNSQTRSSKVRGRTPPAYSVESFIERFEMDSKFIELYRVWVDSGYSKDKKPSIDRKNPLLSYQFDNLQVLTWHENNIKGRGELILTRSTAVVMMDMSGCIIKSFASIKEAEQETGCLTANIVKCCAGKRPHTKGYRWRYDGKGRCKNKDYVPTGSVLVNNEITKMYGGE